MKETREQIDDLLVQLEKQMKEPDDAREQPSQEPQGYRFIDVHIYDYEEQAEDEGAATVEATIEEAEHTQNTEPEAPARQAAPMSTRYKNPVLLALVLLSLLLFEAGIGLYALPVTPPGATIMITQATREIETETSIIIAQTGAADRQGAIRGRTLTITMSEQQTVKTTGTAQQSATNASGMITFYNAAPYTQMIPAGTLVNGAQGVQIVTEQDAFIPAAVYPQFGEASVSAHAANPGEAGNQEAGAIYGPCCRLNISAVSGAFTGGRDARTYPTATQEDITRAAEQMKHRLEGSIAALLPTQLTPEEAMLAPTCMQTTKTDKQPGEEAAAIQITQEATCTATAYNRSQYRQTITKQLDQQAYSELGEGYRLRGTPEQEIIKATSKEQAVTLLVTLKGTYLYQFSQAEQEQIKRRVVGKSIAQAQEILSQMREIESIKITIQSHATTLPTESKHIELQFHNEKGPSV